MHRPILSPYFLDGVAYPYLRGPDYTRPVFREYSRSGNFKTQPLLRMPSLGADEQPVSPPTADAPPVTAATGCDQFASAPNLQAKCLQFNAEMLADLKAHPEKSEYYMKRIQAAQDACASKSGQNIGIWQACYYDAMAASANPWYKNPMYWGAAALGLGLLAMTIRATQTSGY